MTSLDELNAYATIYGRLTVHVPHYMNFIRARYMVWRLNPSVKRAMKLIPILDKILGEKK